MEDVLRDKCRYKRKSNAASIALQRQQAKQKIENTLKNKNSENSTSTNKVSSFSKFIILFWF
jgi:hypothetical protein